MEITGDILERRQAEGGREYFFPVDTKNGLPDWELLLSLFRPAGGVD
jgi:hypothetical protein